MIFLFDNNMSPRIVEAFQLFNEPVMHLSTMYPDGDPGDEVWIPEAGRRGLIVISRDKRITQDAQKLKLLVDYGVGAFFFTKQKNINGWDWIEVVVKHWKNIKAYAESNPRPFSVGIPERGAYKKLGSFTGLR